MSCSLYTIVESLKAQINSLSAQVQRLQLQVNQLQKQVGGDTVTVDNVVAKTVTTKTLILT